MILRPLVLLLLLLNLGYLAWGQGWLQPYGIGPTTQREPQRLARQLHPEAIRIMGPDEVLPSAIEGKEAKPECLQSEVLDGAQAGKLRAGLLKALAAQSWTLDEFTPPTRWIVYMGKYANVGEVNKKHAELAKLGVTGESPRSPALALGLALGTFDFQAQAEAALKTFVERGVRTARVVQDLSPEPGFRLRMPVVDAALKAQLREVQAALPAQSLQPCAAD
jgi:hypothetical protein